MPSCWSSWLGRGGSEAPPPPALIAVETPSVLGDVPEAGLVAAALAEELRAALAAVAPARIQVLGRESTVRLLADADGAGSALARAGDAAPISHRLALSVRPLGSDGELRIVARLLDVVHGTIVWGGGAEATAERMGHSVASIATALAAGIGALADPGERGPAGEAVPLDARRRLSKARYLLEGQGDLELALALVDSVLERHPRLARAHGLRAELQLFRDRPALAAAAAERALALSPGRLDARRALTGTLMLRGEWQRAEATLGEALALGPNDAPTLNALAFLLTARGRFDEAAAAIKQVMRIGPLSPLLVGDAGLMHLWAGRFDKAVRLCRETLQLRPDAAWAHGCVFDALTLAGRTAEAAVQGRDMLGRFGAADRVAPALGPAAVIEEVRRWRVEAWEAVGEPRASVGLALAYADAGRRDDALAALERAAANPSLAVLTAAVQPRFRPLAVSPRYRAVLDRLGLGSGIPRARSTRPG